ncbi:MAG: hypothetical protein N2652_04855 [Kiritimatiellae bacterium]|nr:hypothetical protein [Kiritimatiellia bacterium]
MSTTVLNTARAAPEAPVCPPDPVAMRDAQAFVHTVLLLGAGWAAWSGWRWWRRRPQPSPQRRRTARKPDERAR